MAACSTASRLLDDAFAEGYGGMIVLGFEQPYLPLVDGKEYAIFLFLAAQPELGAAVLVDVYERILDQRVVFAFVHVVELVVELSHLGVVVDGGAGKLVLCSVEGVGVADVLFPSGDKLVNHDILARSWQFVFHNVPLEGRLEVYQRTLVGSQRAFCRVEVVEHHDVDGGFNRLCQVHGEQLVPIRAFPLASRQRLPFHFAREPAVGSVYSLLAIDGGSGPCLAESLHELFDVRGLSAVFHVDGLSGPSVGNVLHFKGFRPFLHRWFFTGRGIIVGRSVVLGIVAACDEKHD